MKTKITFLVIPIICFACVAFLFSGCEDKNKADIDYKKIATVDNPVVSPSGKYLLKITELEKDGVPQNKFAIFKMINGKPSSKAIYTSNDTYRTIDALYFVWDDKDHVWVDSSDLGVFYWKCRNISKWYKYTYYYNTSIIKVPSILKKIDRFL